MEKNVKEASWLLNERIDLIGGYGYGDLISVRIICDEHGEPLEPIRKSDIVFNGKEHGHYKQADFEDKNSCMVYANFKDPVFFSDMAQVMSKNLPFYILIKEYSFSCKTSEIEGREVFSISKKLSGEEDLNLHCILADLREKGLERFVDPVQKVYQKVWDFLLIGPDERCGKTYPAYVK